MLKRAFNKSLVLLIILFPSCFVYFVFVDAYDLKIFRTMQDKLPSPEKVDLRGLREIQASGGYIPRFPTLVKNLSHVKGNKIIVNAESKSTDFVLGLPITLLGYNKTTSNWKYYIRRLMFTGTTQVYPPLLSSEALEAKKYGFIYKNIIIGSRFKTPDQNMDALVAFFDKFAQNSWIHFHCTHGKGRTSMLLVMLDIMKNAPHVALKDIIRRQHHLGSVDLADTSVWINGAYTKDQLESRKKLIEDFYAFVCQRKAGGIQLWSDWRRHHQGTVIPTGSAILPQ